MLILLLLCLCVTANLTNAIPNPQRCYVGGIITSDCQPLINESVLQTYISQFNIDQDYDDDYDIPFRKFTKTLNTSPNRENRKPYENQYATNYELYPIPTVYLKRLDLKTDQLNDTMRKVVSTGTDIYRIKFHSELVLEYKGKSANFGSYSENIVFVESTHNAISSYYFTKNYMLAKYVAEDGIDFLEEMTQKYQPDETKAKEIMAWEVLYYTLYLDILNEIRCSVETLKIVQDTTSKIASRENSLNGLATANFPKPYVLMYRNYFLKEDLPEEKKKELKSLAYLLIYNKEYKINHMFSIYYELAAATIEFTGIRLLSLLMKAIFTPVKSIEDRLLNYKANEMAKELVKDCIDENGWISESNEIFCNEVHEMRSSDILKKYLDIMLIKYTKEIMHINILRKLQNIVTSSEDIDENILHIIVTEAIDMDSGLREIKLGIVKRGIYLLDKYVSSDKQLQSGKVKNTVVAYKWLAELYALFCTTKKRGIETKFYEDGVINSLKRAIELSRTNKLPIDKHLEFLVEKFNCRNKIIVQKWEEGIERLDGWVFKDDNTELPPLIQRKEREDMCTRTFYSFLKFDHAFIHKIDVFIHYYRCRMEQSYKYFSNAIISGYLKSAMSIPVISSEDRYRNRAAHEMYSMHFLKFNATPDKFRTIHDITAQ